MSEMIELGNGSSVPKYLVEALDRYEDFWVGATFPNARPAIVNVILNELQIHMVDHIYETLTKELKMPEDEAKAVAMRLSKRLVV